jgi:hypothetical protein
LAAIENPALKLTQDCKTRWSSLYLMLERCHSQKDAVVAFQIQNLCKKELELLTNADWKSVEAFLAILKPLRDVTGELSGGKCPK